MTQQDSFPPPFQLRQWLVQPDLNRISGPDGPVRIEPRVMAVLLALASRPNTVVSRLDLLDEVWGDTVVGEEILTRAISQLRRVFGDNARRPEFIETIPHNGYRLIAPLTAPASTSTSAPVPTLPGPIAAPPEMPPPPPQRRLWLRPLVVAAVVLGLAAVAFVVLRGGLRRPAGEVTVTAQPLTSYPGREFHPALAPDGTRVAFAWSGTEPGQTSIYIKQRGNEQALRLTTAAGWAAWPTWSPDGQAVAFVQTNADVSRIGIVPSLGGAVRWLHRVSGPVEGLDWSPAGEQLAFAARDTATGYYRVYLCRLADLSVRPLPVSRTDDAGDFQPRFGPAGRRLAWLGTDGAGGDGVYVADITGSEAQTITTTLTRLQGLTWTADGKGLVYAAAADGLYQLWVVGSTGGSPRRIALPGQFAWNPTIARETGDLAYEQVRVDQDLWRITLVQDGHQGLASMPFLASTRWESSPDFRPTGGAIAFVSSRSGQPEIWLATDRGANPRQLTQLGASAITNLLWAPDGRQLACNAVLAGHSRIVVVDGASGVTRKVSVGRDHELFVGWGSSATEVLLAARSARSGWQVYRQDLAGGRPVPITRQGGLTARVAADGRTFYFTRPDRPGLWRRRIGGRIAPELVLADLQPRDRFNWRLAGDRILWVLRDGGMAFLMEYGLRSGQSVMLAELPGLHGSGLAMAPEGDVFVYPRWGEMAGDLMFIAGGGK